VRKVVVVEVVVVEKSRSRSRYSEFVSRKQLKRDVKKAASGCVDDVCVEV